MRNLVKSYFNKIEEILEDAIEIDSNHVLLAFQGDAMQWDNRRFLNSIKSRNTESLRKLNCVVLIYIKSSLVLSRKAVYRDTDGIYFKHNTKKKYLIYEEVPKHMK